MSFGTRLQSILVLVMLSAATIIVEAQGQETFQRVEAPAGSSLVLRAGSRDAGTKVLPRPEIRNKLLPKTASIVVNYNGFSPDAQAAFEHAVDIWEQLVSSPVEIRIEATWEPLGPGLLGGASARAFWGNGTNAFPDALADALNGSDLAAGQPDILASFNSDLGAWYLGTDANPLPGTFDLVTVVLHEIGHGLGFSGQMSVTSGIGFSNLTSPTIFASLAEDLAGNAVTNETFYPDPSVALGNLLQSGDVYFGGTNATAVNGGVRPELYAPMQWLPGSSFSHLDEMVFPPGDPDSLMTPFLDPLEVIHDPGPIALCLFRDMGWTTDVTCEPSPEFADVGDLVVPGFEVDTENPGGASTQFSIVNMTDVEQEVEVRYFTETITPVSQRTDVIMLPANATYATDVGFIADELEVDTDGYARGLVVVKSASPTAIEGDYFRIDYSNDFAAGDRMVTTADFCNLHHLRFLDFGSGSVLRILLNQPLGSSDPSYQMEILDFSGNPISVISKFSDENLVILDVLDLVEVPFGTINFDFSAAGGGVATARYSAFGQFSVELHSVCRD